MNALDLQQLWTWLGQQPLIGWPLVTGVVLILASLLADRLPPVVEKRRGLLMVIGLVLVLAVVAPRVVQQLGGDVPLR